MTPNQLKARFPYMFEGEYMELAFPRGWFAIFVQLCEQIDLLLGADRRGFHWVQIKEKFGSARYHYELEPAEGEDVYPRPPPSSPAAIERLRIRTEIRELIGRAHSASCSHCIVCGRPGQLHEFEWTLVLCDEHIAQRETGGLGNFYLEEDDSDASSPGTGASGHEEPS